MRLAVILCLCACLLAIGGSAVWIAASVQRVAGATESSELLAAASLQSTAATLREARQTLDLLPGESVAWRATVAGLAQPVSTGATALLRDTNASLNAPGGAIGQVAASVSGVRADLGPVLENAAAAGGELDLSLRQWRPQVLGLFAAAKVTAGQTATTMRALQEATPGFLVTWQEIGANVKATTAASTEASLATARTMGNLEKATRPLPAWLRIPLSITGAVAPTVAGAVSAAAAAGAFH